MDRVMEINKTNQRRLDANLLFNCAALKHKDVILPYLNIFIHLALGDISY